MPAPCTIVYLLDDDLDEFPIRLDGSGYSDIAAYRNAMIEAQGLIEAGKWAPNGQLKLGRVEDPKDDD